MSWVTHARLEVDFHIHPLTARSGVPYEGLPAPAPPSAARSSFAALVTPLGTLSKLRCGQGPNVLTTPSEEVYNGVLKPATAAAIVEASGPPPVVAFVLRPCVPHTITRSTGKLQRRHPPPSPRADRLLEPSARRGRERLQSHRRRRRLVQERLARRGPGLVQRLRLGGGLQG